MKDKNNKTPETGEKKGLTPAQKKSLKRVLLLALSTVLCFTLYRVLLFYGEMTDKTFGAFVVMVVYTALFCGFGLAYLIYTRFLYRKGLTMEQLPADWSEEQKTEFLADGERRLEKSKWMLMILFPIILTFLIDSVDIFLLDLFR